MVRKEQSHVLSIQLHCVNSRTPKAPKEGSRSRLLINILYQIYETVRKGEKKNTTNYLWHTTSPMTNFQDAKCNKSVTKANIFKLMKSSHYVTISAWALRGSVLLHSAGVGAHMFLWRDKITYSSDSYLKSMNNTKCCQIAEKWEIGVGRKISRGFLEIFTLNLKNSLMKWSFVGKDKRADVCGNDRKWCSVARFRKQTAWLQILVQPCFKLFTLGFAHLLEEINFVTVIRTLPITH